MGYQVSFFSNDGFQNILSGVILRQSLLDLLVIIALGTTTANPECHKSLSGMLKDFECHLYNAILFACRFDQAMVAFLDCLQQVV